MKFSVIIPTYKRPERIRQSIESVLKQTYKDVEIIVVDDNGKGSDMQQRTFNEVQKVKCNQNIKYVTHETNKGACAARNTGIKVSEGEVIAFLDDDDCWDELFLDEMKTKIESGEVIVYSNFYRVDENGIFFNPKEQYYSGNIQSQLLEGWCPASTSLFCIRKECFEKVGLFDEKLKNFEEYDLWLRLSEVYKFCFCDKRLVIKDETNHNQLTNDFSSRKIACEQLLDMWSKRLTNKDQIEAFEIFIRGQMEFVAVNEVLNKLKNNISFTELVNLMNEKKLRNKKKFSVVLAFLFGVNTLESFKEYYRMILGCKKYVN